MTDTPERDTPLRIGLYLDSLIQPAWTAEIIRQIHDSDIAQITLIVVNQITDERSALQKIWQNRNHLLYAAYSVFDGRFNAYEPDAYADVDMQPLLENVPIVKLTPERKNGYIDRFSDADVESIRAYDLDVVLRFGFKILRGDALKTATYGVWSYHHGDNTQYRGQPAGFWEVMQGNPVTGCILQILSDDLDGGTVIYRSFSATHPYSANQNEQNILWRSVPFVMRKLRDVYHDSALDCDESSFVTPYPNRLYKRPTNFEMVGLMSRLIWRVMSVIFLRVFFKYQWFLQFRRGTPVPDAFYRYRTLASSGERFYADPFIVHESGRDYVFFEDFPYSIGKGILSAFELLSDGTHTEPVVILEKPYHLSYPFIFRWQGSYYMIPETSQNRSIDVYRCTDFPYTWTFQKTLLPDIQAVDATLFEHEGLWWMFFTASDHNTRLDDELFIYYADNPLATWTPHKRNPVRSDGRDARPGGAIFEHNGMIIRPAQNSTRRRQEKLVVHRILELNTETYREEKLTEVDPRWLPDMVAVHTLNHAGGISIIDAKVRIFRPLYRRWRRQQMKNRL